MGSSPVDSGTQKAASTGAQSTDATTTANATAAQNTANQGEQSLFGTYNPKTNSYSGGTESQFLNPSSLNQNGLSGSYLNAYNNAANAGAATAQNAVGTTMQQMANQGMGKSPAGFEADQMRQAYNTQAANQGNLYTQEAGAQQTQAETNYANANNMLNSDTQSQQALALQGNQAAAGNYASLYGTASQQKANPVMQLATAGIGAAGQAATGSMGSGSGSGGGCWIAAEIFGGWHDPRTILVREWIFGPFAATPIGNLITRVYLRFGERIAERIRRNESLRNVFEAIFIRALWRAQAWKGGNQ